MSTWKHEVHLSHAHQVVTPEYRPRNVPLATTHDLIRCDEDLFFGWVSKENPNVR